MNLSLDYFLWFGTCIILFFIYVIYVMIIENSGKRKNLLCEGFSGGGSEIWTPDTTGMNRLL